jgi:hypothetical protein
MTVEGSRIVSRTPRRCGDLGEAERLSLLSQSLPEVEMPGSLPFGWCSAPLHDFRTNFIAWAANAHPTMHYYILDRASSATPQLLHSPAQDATCGAAPAGVEQSDSAPGHNQINRNAIGNGHGKKYSWRGRDPSVYAFDLDPPLPHIQGHHLDAVYLVAQRNRREFGQLPPECVPAAHHLTHGCIAPEAEIESAARLGPATGNAGDDAVPLAPTRDLEPGDLSWKRNFPHLGRDEGRTQCAPACTLLRASAAPLPRFPAAPPTTHPPARSPRPAIAAARRCARTHARSGPHCEWCWGLPRPAPPGPWPCRP